MAQKANWRKELKKAARRRAQHPPRPVAADMLLKVGRRKQSQIIDDHVDVLQNIEFVLVTAWEETNDVDDRTVAQALKSTLLGRPPEDPIVQWLLDCLGEMRDQRLDVSDEQWADCLRVVYRSVRRHSSVARGETSYLEFASAFIV